MLFNSWQFASFYLSIFVAYWLLQRRLRLQNLLLLIGSYYFYACWDWRFLGLIVLSTAIDFVCGRQLDKRRLPDGADQALAEHPYARGRRARRWILFVSIAANLGILGFFKYFDFFAESCARLLDTMGIPLEVRLLNVVLPVGISFYTFQTMSYTIDVYRNQLRAYPTLLQFAVFVSFFPQLVAGPIVRARDFLPQIAQRRRFRAEQFHEGGFLILWGLFKKVVVADNLAMVVDKAFAADASPHGGAVLIALYAFAVQIYCDFSGYSNMARGCAKLMGIDICCNFNLPYFASNPSEFWKRWHISLSSWLRDYLYIPLGGSRRGVRRTCINLLLTMVLGGLWHGAAWTFVVWGLYQGALLMVHKATMPLTARLSAGLPDRLRVAIRVVAVVLFFNLVCLGWLIFRADSLAQIGHMLGALSSGISLHGSGVTLLLAYALPVLVMQCGQYACKDLNVLFRSPAAVRGLSYVTMFYGIVVFGFRAERPFIYFQF